MRSHNELAIIKNKYVAFKRIFLEYLFHIGGEGSVLKSEIQCQDMNIVNFRYQQILGEKMETNDNDFNIESIETK